MSTTSQRKPSSRASLGAALALGLLSGASSAQRSNEPVDFRTYRRTPEGETQEFHGPAQWTEREVEHLLNRAAFGARQSQIRAWAEKSPEELVAHLLEWEGELEPFYIASPKVSAELVRSLDPAEKGALVDRLREGDRRQFHAFVSWWFERMLRGDDPLRERMTLFWHGLFTSSMDVVKRSEPMIRQNELLREHALGSYGTMLREMLRDPALLVYLDNDESKKEHPNENLARELLELFSLGEGNYDERDVQEAARALTGRTVDRGEYVFDMEAHDRGTKHVLGRYGRIGGNQLVDLILAEEACPRWVVFRLITWLEGVEPAPERLQAYADLLYDSDYQIRPVLRRLFLDPEFYRDEVLGARVTSPVDYLVGSARRLGIAPPPAFLATASRMLGQALLEPPSVKGWDEGEAWITTSSLMMRGNLAGVMLGVIDERDGELSADSIAMEMSSEMSGEMSMEMTMDEQGLLDEMVLDEEPDAAMDEDAEEDEDEGRAFARALGSSGRGSFGHVVRVLDEIGYRPDLHRTAWLGRLGASTDREIVQALADELLAIEPPAETVDFLVAHLAQDREALGLDEGRLLSRRVDPEPLLRRLAHLILSLPEAQLE